jgi:prevent-host-death family protein
MDMSTGEAKNNFSRLLRAAESGDTVVITRHGKPVAQIGPPARHKRVRLGGMRDRIRLLPGWDAPIDPDDLLAEKP